MPRVNKLDREEGRAMGRDAKNSIISWAGTLALIGMLWALLHFDIGGNIPDPWLWAAVGFVIGANVLKSVWDKFRRPSTKVR